MNNQQLGAQAESLVCNYLIDKGYEILERNWRFKRAEIDIIAKENEILIFVEVKYRSYNYYGSPEDSVDEKKEKLLLDAGAAYAEEIGHDWAVRFDIISVLKENQNFNIKHYPDAFYPTW